LKEKLAHNAVQRKYAEMVSGIVVVKTNPFKDGYAEAVVIVSLSLK